MTGMMKSGMVGMDPTWEGDFTPPVGVVAELLVMPLAQTQFTMCKLVTLGGVMSPLETPLTCRILIIGSLFPWIHDLAYTVLYVLFSDVLHYLHSIQYVWLEMAICIGHS
jgi:hypothetical protein